MGTLSRVIRLGMTDVSSSPGRFVSHAEWQTQNPYGERPGPGGFLLEGGLREDLEDKYH